MALFYVLSAILLLVISIRSIAKSLKKGAISYEYSRSEYRNFDSYAFLNRK